MTGDRLFVDTNVLLRATHSNLGAHTVTAAYLAQRQREGTELWISRQVIREYLVQVTRPGLFERPLNGSEAAILAAELQALFRVADDDVGVTSQLLRLLREYPVGGKQIHDANIIATMLTCGVDQLVTMNYSDMQRFSPLVDVIHLQVES